MGRLRHPALVVSLVLGLIHVSSAEEHGSALDGLLGRKAGQEAEATPSPRRPSDELPARRAAISQRLAAAQKALEGADAAESKALGGEIERLKRAKATMAQEQAALATNGERVLQKKMLAEQLAAFSGVDDSPPYSFFLLDQFRDEQFVLEQRAENAAGAVRSAADTLQEARNTAEEARRKLRGLADSQHDHGASDGKATPTSHKFAQLDAEIATEQLELRKIELAGEKLNQEVIALQIDLVARKIEQIAPQVVLSDEELREKLVELDKEEADLEFAQTEAEQRLVYLSGRVEEAENAAQLAVAPDPRAAAELETRRLARAAQQQYLNMLGKQISRLADRREAWSRRFAVERNKATRPQMIDWASEAAEKLEQLTREHRLQVRELSDARKRLADLEQSPASKAPEGGELDRSLAEQRRIYQELIDRAGQSLTSIELARRVHGRLLADIRDDRLNLAQRLAIAWDYATHIWNYELVVSDDQPVTISMVVWGVVLLVAGLMFSRWASNTFAHRFLPRLGVHERAAAALKAISFYALVSLTALVALRWVNVPLTLFTFLGGALAIGVGFGSQNLVNNFISGLILLAERPIRVGDVIEIDGLVGTVDTIGARSTRVCTGANYEIIIPNSSLLEKNVVNWTLSDKRVRSTIMVGVAYGSPTREVARLLKKAAEEHGLVLDKPEPFVVFADFGDNALHFELNYWIQIRAMSERRRVESDLRFIIDQYFRDAGLVIAYPQRDLHISSDQPLKVTMLPSEGEGVSDIARAA